MLLGPCNRFKEDKFASVFIRVGQVRKSAHTIGMLSRSSIKKHKYEIFKTQARNQKKLERFQKCISSPVQSWVTFARQFQRWINIWKTLLALARCQSALSGLGRSVILINSVEWPTIYAPVCSSFSLILPFLNHYKTTTKKNCAFTFTCIAFTVPTDLAKLSLLGHFNRCWWKARLHQCRNVKPCELAYFYTSISD